MEIISLKCNNCGADLQIPEQTKFFNCSSCGSSLAIKHTSNAIFTEVLDIIEDNTQEIVQQSELILIEKEIARLDREWMLERSKYEIKSKSGNYYPDDKEANSSIGSSIIGFLFLGFALAFLCFWIYMAPPPFKYFGIGILIILGFSFIASVFDTSASTNKRNYLNAKDRYQKKRQELLVRLKQKKTTTSNENGRL